MERQRLFQGLFCWPKSKHPLKLTIFELANFKYMNARDEQLLNGIRNKDRGAITELFTEYFKPCAKTVLKDGGTIDDAREVFQEVLFSLMTRIDSPDFTIKSNLSGYLYQSCFYQWVATKRKQRKYIPTEDKVLVTIPDDGEAIIAEKQEKEALYEAMEGCMRTLNLECQQGLNLFFYEKKRDKEIAGIMGYTTAYVKQHRSRCMKKLKKCMAS